MRSGANIALVGFMGTGKTEVGRALAARLDRPFVDLDAIVEERQGKPIARIFAEEGEGVFRALERDIVREFSARDSLVLATGGGVVLDPANLDDLAADGFVVCLTATPSTILARVGDDRQRPLLAGPDRAERIAELLQSRRDLYARVAVQVATDGLEVAAVAGQVLAEFDRWCEAI